MFAKQTYRKSKKRAIFASALYCVAMFHLMPWISRFFSVFMGEYAFISRCAFFPPLADQSCDLLVQKRKDSILTCVAFVI
jgi:hypothetical protein